VGGHQAEVTERAAIVINRAALLSFSYNTNVFSSKRVRTFEMLLQDMFSAYSSSTGASASGGDSDGHKASAGGGAATAGAGGGSGGASNAPGVTVTGAVTATAGGRKKEDSIKVRSITWHTMMRHVH
jgi:hypothetical protein